MITKRSNRDRGQMNMPAAEPAADGDPFLYGPFVPNQEDDRLGDIAAQDQRAERLHDAIDDLPERQAEFIRLTLEGLNQVEIAAKLGISQAAVSQGLARAKAALAAELADLY